jgi:hypothetical protein
LACFILLGILFLSVKDDVDNNNNSHATSTTTSTANNNNNNNSNDNNNHIQQVEIKTPVPVMTIESSTDSKNEDKPDNTESNIESSNDDDDVDNEDDDDDEDDQNDNKNPFGYSQYATILPLIDHPLLPNGDETKEALIGKYGKWHFWDGDESNRPREDYFGKYPNRDVPGNEFPLEAWQADAVFVNHFLNDADQLITRTMEAIFVEYGHGKPLDPDGLAERMKIFHWSRPDLSTTNEPPAKYGKNGDQGDGGWTTRRSFDGLVRRLLHAMMTQDTFTVVMGGHSAAVGQGYVVNVHIYIIMLIHLRAVRHVSPPVLFPSKYYTQ